MDWLTTAASLAVLGFSLRWNWWRLPKKGIPVIMYHKIGIPPVDSKQKYLWVSQERFDWQLATLKAKGFECVTFADIKKGKLPAKPVMLTFDDGYLNNRTEALPILQKHGMRGVFYIVTEAIGRDNFWHNPDSEIRIPMMGESDLRVLLDAGQEIGSHTLTHTRMTTLSPEKAREELAASKKKLETMLGVPMLSFAFPYGNGEDNADLVKAAHDTGYEWVIGIHSGIWDGKDAYNPLPRIFAKGGEAKLDFHLQLSRGRSRL